MCTDEQVELAVDASIEGRHARRDDKPRGDNPHVVGTSDHRYWKYGWDGEDKAIIEHMEENRD